MISPRFPARGAVAHRPASTSSAPSHNIKPGRRRQLHDSSLSTTAFALLLLCFAALCPAVTAASIARLQLPSQLEPFADRQGQARLDRRFNIQQDQQTSTTDAVLSTTASPARQLQITTTTTPTTDASFLVQSTTSATTDSTLGSSSSSDATTIPRSTSTSSAPAIVETAYALPRPFDASIGTNFTTQTCPAFFDSFLNNATFQSCLPLSLLIQTSQAFFQAEGSTPYMSAILDATCNVVFPACSALMSELATELVSSEHCAQDYSYENPLVVQAYVGLLAYVPLYQAGCLKQPMGDDNEEQYCFAAAVANASNPADAYIYYLPLGDPLPNTSTSQYPTCNSCVKQTMIFFAGAAANASQPLSLDYASAAHFIDQGCGPAFATESVTPLPNAASSPSMLGVDAVGLVASSVLLAWVGGVAFLAVL